MWHAWERGETCRGFWWESPKESDHLEDQGVDGRMRLEWISGILGCSGFVWLRTGTGGGFGFWRHGVSSLSCLTNPWKYRTFYFSIHRKMEPSRLGLTVAAIKMLFYVKTTARRNVCNNKTLGP
jgi:hypothetical protein